MTAPAPGASPEVTIRKVLLQVAYERRHVEPALVDILAALTAAPPLREEAIRREERERIAGELRETAQRMREVSAETIAPALGFAAAGAFNRFADRLAPRASAGEREGKP
jgi:hypothetical protein